MELLTTASLLTDISLWNKSDEPYIMSDMLTLLELQPTVINVLYNLEVHGLYIYFMIYSYLCFWYLSTIIARKLLRQTTSNERLTFTFTKVTQ